MNRPILSRHIENFTSYLSQENDLASKHLVYVSVNKASDT